jgi:hypothetical protein
MSPELCSTFARILGRCKVFGARDLILLSDGLLGEHEMLQLLE